MKAAIYTRVSTDEQARDGLSLAVQERRCRAAAEAHDAIAIDTYRDDGYTSRDLDRPALQRLLDRLDRYDRIYVLDQSRWTRDPEHLEQLRRHLLDAGVALVPLSMPVDHETPQGQLVSRVTLAADRFTIDVARAKCIASLRDRAERGLHHGNPPTGYLLPDNSDEPLRIDPEHAPTVRRMFKMAARGLAPAAIARTLTGEGVRGQRGAAAWHAGTIRDILRNPVYRGVVCHGGKEFPGSHEALVEPARWYRVQAIMQSRSIEHPKRRTRLSSLFSCGVCGGRVARQPGHGYPAYRCEERYDRPPEDRHVPLQKSAAAVEPVLWAHTSRLLSGDVLEAAVARVDAAAQADPDPAEELAAVEERIHWNLEVAEAGGMPAEWVAERNAELLARREELLSVGDGGGAMDPGALAELRERGDAVAWLREREESVQLHYLGMLYTTLRMHVEGLEFVHAVDIESVRVAWPEWDASANAWGPVHLS